MTRRRSTSYLLQRLKVAVKDRDESLASRIRQRINVIDPENDEVQAISGLIVIDDSQVSVGPPMSPPAISRTGARWLYLLAGILAGVAVILAGYLVWKPTPSNGAQNQRNTPPVEVRPPVASSKATKTIFRPKPFKVALTVRGGSGRVYINGKSKGRVSRRTFKLDPGKHTIEVRGRGKRVKKTLKVEDGSTVSLIVDLKRGKMTVK
jgi:hypothetical protein